jgi:hypothetical protein
MRQGDQIKTLGAVLRVTSTRQGCQVKRLGPVIVYRLHRFEHGRCGQEVYHLHLWRRGGREGCLANQPLAPLVI